MIRIQYYKTMKLLTANLHLIPVSFDPVTHLVRPSIACDEMYALHDCIEPDIGDVSLDSYETLSQIEQGINIETYRA